MFRNAPDKNINISPLFRKNELINYRSGFSESHLLCWTAQHHHYEFVFTFRLEVCCQAISSVLGLPCFSPYISRLVHEQMGIFPCFFPYLHLLAHYCLQLGCVLRGTHNFEAFWNLPQYFSQKSLVFDGGIGLKTKWSVKTVRVDIVGLLQP